MLYNNGIETRDIWSEVSRFFMKEQYKPQHMTLEKFYTKNKFGLLIDLRSMASQKMHGSGTRLVNTTDGVQLEIQRDAKGAETLNCHVFVISNSQFNIVDRQLQSVYSIQRIDRWPDQLAGQDSVSREPALWPIQRQV